MCGISGFLGDFGEGDLRAMTAALRHRGPDDMGHFIDPVCGVGLAQTRLSIIDLSPAGHQPMVDGSGRYLITFNGEIYNFLELRAELEREGVSFRGHSDTEVLLEAYARRGADILSRLNGIFAFAIWDRVECKLLLARDALGVKPLYFTSGRNGFAFASELKALLSVVDDRTLDEASLHRYMTYLWCPGDGTPLRSVRKLGPGEAVVWTRKGMERKWNWYRLPALRHVERSQAEGGVVESVGETLRRAVERQLVADVPVGAFLSGGLDSSAIVAFASRAQAGIRCFTIDLVGGGDVGFANDLPYARRVASHLGVPLDVVTVDAGGMANDFAGMIERLDEPMADPAPLNVLYISELARSQGIKVLLSGAGGDDLFTGYRRHRALELEWMWSWLPESVREFIGHRAKIVDARSALGRRVQRLTGNMAGQPDERLAGYFRWAEQDTLDGLYSMAFRERVGSVQADWVMREFLAAMPVETPRLERMLGLEQRFFLTDHNLAYTDRMSMAAGVEVRVPFLDLDLVELAARVPARLKLRHGEAKWVLKKAMEPYLPREIIYRPKTGFGAPLRRWLRTELRPLVADLLGESALRKRGIFEPSAVASFLERDEAGAVDGAYTILAMMSIELWCRSYMDGR